MEISPSMQVCMSLLASANMITSGMTVAYPAVALPAMNQSNSGLELTNDQSSWIASVSHLTMIVGSVALGPILDKWGRRLGFIVTGVSSLLGWIIIGMMPQSLSCLYIGRLLNGLGACSVVTSVFMAEVTSPAIRNILTVFKNTSFSVGLTFMYLLGITFRDNWSAMALFGAIIPLVCLVSALFILPESSVWHENQNNIKKRCTYSELYKAYRKRPEVYKPMNIMNSLLILRQLSGTSVILTYAINLVEVAGVGGDPHVVTVLLGVTRIIAGLVGCALSGWLGRRIPVSWSGALMSVTMLWLARNITADNQDNSTYADTIVLIIFMFSSTIFSSICQALVGEVFPTDVRGLCTGLSTCLSYLSSFIAVKLYPELLTYLGRTNLFLMYGTFCVFGTLIAILTLPETKDKSLTEIQALFTKNNTAVLTETKDSVACSPVEVELLVLPTNNR
ncbi:hypothetical protein O3M35_007617 [Rhynocoris fuscipes]|uniref:Major facilitator superfamily (MFS) profile domain-containing protein n=1 Tax=Rhynocoris fuscipes TaxID=488301 RepID=A0AAW1DFB1_9HEMI